MRKITFFVVLLISASCVSKNNQSQILTDKEWESVLIATLPFAEGNKPLIFFEYGNIGLKEITSVVYSISADLGYEYNDSISSNINTRNNNPITNKLDTMFNINFLYDTAGFNNNFVIYSEPFYVNDKIICISMSNRKIIENTVSDQVFFLKNERGSFKIIEYYDDKKDQFYRPAPLF